MSITKNLISKRVLYLSIAVIMAMTVTTMPVLANELDGVATQVSTVMESVWNVLKLLAIPVGSVAVAVNGFKILYGGAKQADEAKSALIRVVVAIVIIVFAPTVVRMISNGIGAGSWT